MDNNANKNRVKVNQNTGNGIQPTGANSIFANLNYNRIPTASHIMTPLSLNNHSTHGTHSTHHLEQSNTRQSYNKSTEQIFYEQVTEAIVGIQNNIDRVDPVILELLKRLQQHDSNRESHHHQHHSNNNIINDGNNNNTGNNHHTHNHHLGFDNIQQSQDSKNYNTQSKQSIDYSFNDSDAKEYPQGTIFICDLCFQKFDDNVEYKKHCKDHFNKNGNLHICPKCFKGFARKDAMRRHMGTKTCERNRKKLIEENNGTMPGKPPTERP